MPSPHMHTAVGPWILELGETTPHSFVASEDKDHTRRREYHLTTILPRCHFLLSSLFRTELDFALCHTILYDIHDHGFLK